MIRTPQIHVQDHQMKTPFLCLWTCLQSPDLIFCIQLCWSAYFVFTWSRRLFWLKIRTCPLSWMQLTQLAIFSFPSFWNERLLRELEYPFDDDDDSNDSLRICETSLTTIPDHLEATPPPSSSFIPQIRKERRASGRRKNWEERCDIQAGVLHATDTTLDFISRNALNRNRSFIEHIREIPGFEKSRGRIASVPKSPLSSSGKRNAKSKYIIGHGSSSDEDDIEDVVGQKVKCFDEPFLPFGMSRSWGRKLLLVVRWLSSFTEWFSKLFQLMLTSRGLCLVIFK